MRRGYLFVFIVLILASGHAPGSWGGVPLISKNVRVAIKRKISSFCVTGSNIKIFDFKHKKTILSYVGKATLSLTSTRPGELKINDRDFALDHIIIHSSPALLAINERPYRGILDLYVEPGGFLIVNHIRLKEYLASLLSLEMRASWPIETLKAQSVAARTYALACMIENVDGKYDIESDVRDQVYDGSHFEDQRTLNAVNLSAGEVLTFNGIVLKTYYHANSGGTTENPAEIWGGNKSYMPGVTDPYAFNTPGYHWVMRLSLKKLTKLLKERGYPFTYLFEVSASDYTSSGRIRKVRIDTEKKAFFLSGKEFRELVGESKLKSTRFIVTAKSNSEIEFSGRGLGHGAGLSQWSAKKMGEAGYKHWQILKKFYPQLALKKLW